MTKNELYTELANTETQYGLSPIDVNRILLDFFSQNVVIKRGENRHPDALALCEWLLDSEKEVEAYFRREENWKDMSRVNALIVDDNVRYRIKPQEPVYEWQFYLELNELGEIGRTPYLTEEEFANSMSIEMGLYWEKDESTKRVRNEKH